MATCLSASCVLITGAPCLYGEAQSNPYVSQGAPTASLTEAISTTDSPAGKKLAGVPNHTDSAIALSAPPVRNNSVVSLDVVQGNRLGVKSEPRPTRLPAVTKPAEEVIANSKAPVKRPQLLPPVDQPTQTKVASSVEPESAGHSSTGQSPTKELDASDYVLEGLGQADPMPVFHSAAADETELGHAQAASNSMSLKPQITSEEVAMPTVELGAPRIAFSPSRVIDSKRPIRPVEVSRKSFDTHATQIVSSNKVAPFGATALQSIGDAPGSSSRMQVMPSPRISAEASTASMGSTELAMNWLPSTTSTSSQQDAQRYLEQAMREYTRKAWASAEASAWESLTSSAEGIDIARRDASFGANRAASSALNDLQAARTAIRESRDFAGKYGPLNSDAVNRIVLSHTTEVLKNQSLQNVPPIDATDRYLNEARVLLAPLAKFRIEAAQALDLLAAIHLGRNDEQRLPSQTALCLRRAALQGQPGNGSLAGRLGMHLAALGLDKEAKWALQHAIAVEPTPEVAQALDVVSGREGDRAEAIRLAAQMQSRLPAGYEQSRGPVPTVVQLTPRQFAAASKSQMAPKSQIVSQHVNSAPRSIQRTSAVEGQSSDTAISESNDSDAVISSAYVIGGLNESSDPAYYKTNEPKSRVRKMMDSVGKFWQ